MIPRRILFFGLCLLALAGSLVAQPSELPEAVSSDSAGSDLGSIVETVSWRVHFRNATDADGRRSFRDLMGEASERLNDDPTAQAFHAAAELLTAVRRFNPFSKWLGFNKWTGRLDEQVTKDPANADILFLRLTVADSAPGFLGYNDTFESDCGAVRDALTNGYWSGDAGYEQFVWTTYDNIKSCH